MKNKKKKLSIKSKSIHGLSDKQMTKLIGGLLPKADGRSVIQFEDAER